MGQLVLAGEELSVELPDEPEPAEELSFELPEELSFELPDSDEPDLEPEPDELFEPEEPDEERLSFL